MRACVGGYASRYAMLRPDKKWTRLGLWGCDTYHYPGYDIWHEVARLHLTLVRELLCRPDVSPGFLYPFPRNLKSKSRNLWWAMIRLCKLLDNLLHPGTAWEWTRKHLVNERVYLCGGVEFQGGGKRINSFCYPLLTHICIQEPAEIEQVIVSAMKKRTSVEPEDGDMETNSKAAVR